jgi:nucleoside diphosphate kinase
LKKHYADLAGRPFFPGLVKYMSSGPVVPMVSFVVYLCEQDDNVVSMPRLLRMVVVKRTRVWSLAL